MRSSPPLGWTVEATKQDLDRVAADVRAEMRALRAEVHEAKRQQDLIMALAANAVLVSVIVIVAQLLTG